jgi:hypothetical protein
MMPGIGLQITGAAAVTENAEHRRQQQETLRIRQAAADRPSGIALRKLISASGTF